MEKVLKSGMVLENVVLKDVVGTFVLDPNPPYLILEIEENQRTEISKMLKENDIDEDILEYTCERNDETGKLELSISDLEEKFIKSLEAEVGKKVTVTYELVDSDYMGEFMPMLNVTVVEAL